MPLSQYQEKLLASHQTDPFTGLSQSQVSQIQNNASNGLNLMNSPLNLPSWVCCLLPCLKHIPSMKLFKQITPEDAEVFRDSHWVCYDAASVLKGDIIRLSDGDLVPADCTVLSLGMEWDTNNSESTQKSIVVNSMEELLVDISNITGEDRPRIACLMKDGTTTPTRLFYGSRVIQGSCLALVTSIGEHTLLAKLIREKKWPPKAKNGYASIGTEEHVHLEDTDHDEFHTAEQGISLIERN